MCDFAAEDDFKDIVCARKYECDTNEQYKNDTAKSGMWENSEKAEPGFFPLETWKFNKLPFIPDKKNLFFLTVIRLTQSISMDASSCFQLHLPELDIAYKHKMKLQSFSRRLTT